MEKSRRSFWRMASSAAEDLVFYRVTPDEIIFLRLRHGGMDLTALLAGN